MLASGSTVTARHPSVEGLARYPQPAMLSSSSRLQPRGWHPIGLERVTSAAKASVNGLATARVACPGAVSTMRSLARQHLPLEHRLDRTACDRLLVKRYCPYPSECPPAHHARPAARRAPRHCCGARIGAHRQQEDLQIRAGIRCTVEEIGQDRELRLPQRKTCPRADVTAPFRASKMKFSARRRP